MKKFILVLTLAILHFLTQPSFAIEEVFLEIEGENGETVEEDVITDDEWFFDLEGKTLREKIHEIQTTEITDTSKPHYLLEEILTKEFSENSPIHSAHLFGYYRGGLGIDFYPDDIDTGYGFGSIEGGVNGKLKNEKTFYEARLRFTPQGNQNFLSFMPSNLYIASKAIPHHTLIVGNTRVATGYEGTKSSSVIPLYARSQISRTFGNTRKVGIRIKGNYDLIEYDAGGYSSDNYFKEFFPGAEFAGWVTLKPLGKTNGKYGSLKIGSGITTGHNNFNYTVLGAYASYEYKKFYANFEWGKADGYNGYRELSDKKAEGFYTTLGYKITPKIQLVGRYDQFKPDMRFSDHIKREYSAGINYFIKGQALKLILNYVFCQNNFQKDSHRIVVGTQIML